MAILIALAVSMSRADNIPAGEAARMLQAASRPVASGAAPAPDVGTPYAWWKMTGTDTNAAGNLLDSAASGYTFTNKGAVLVSTNAYFYKFTNGASYTSMRGTNVPSSMAHTSFTVSAWVYIVGTNAGGSAILFQEVGSFYAWECVANYKDTGRPSLLVSTDDGSTKIMYQLPVTNVVFLNRWHHIAMRYDGGVNTNGSMRTYVDGSVVATNSVISGAFTGLNPTRFPLALGGNSAAWSMNGYIDDVRFFKNESLTDTQVNNIYLQGRPNP
jgi:hypothetical protein